MKPVYQKNKLAEKQMAFVVDQYFKRKSELAKNKFVKNHERFAFYETKLNDSIKLFFEYLPDQEDEVVLFYNNINNTWKSVCAKANRLHSKLNLNPFGFELLCNRFILINKIIELEPRLVPEELMLLDDEDLEVLKTSKIARSFKVDFDATKTTVAIAGIADAKSIAVSVTWYQSIINKIYSLANGIRKKWSKQSSKNSYHKEEGTLDILQENAGKA